MRQQTRVTRVLLYDGMLRVSGLAAVGGFLEQQAVGAVLGVGWRFVFDVGHGAFFAVAAEKL